MMKFIHLKDSQPAALFAWARKLIDDLNRYGDTLAALPGPYVDDNAAASAGIPVGSGYIDAAGVARRRIA